MSPEPSCLRFGICLFANNGGYKGIQKGGKRGVLKMVPFFCKRVVERIEGWPFFPNNEKAGR